MSEFFEKALDSKEIFCGKVIRVTLDSIELQNGNTSLREVVHHNGGAGVVALREDGHIALVRQFRYAVGREMLEIPAGKIEKNEPPLETARRELREEAGVLADHLQAFGEVHPTCAYCTETIYIFLATGLHTTTQDLDSDEFLSVIWMDLDEAFSRVMDGEITDSKTVSGILRAHALRTAGTLG